MSGREGGEEHPRNSSRVTCCFVVTEKMESRVEGRAFPLMTLFPNWQAVLWQALTIMALLAGPSASSPSTGQRHGPLHDYGSSAPLAGLEGLLTPTQSTLHGENPTGVGEPPPPPRGEEKPPESLLLREGRSPRAQVKGRAQKGQRGKGGRGKAKQRGCHLQTQLVKVRELGLGHDSDELVRFRYCSGSCQRARSNHDVSLAYLLSAGTLRPSPPARVLSHPCCRPTRYEAVSFMDVHNTWQTVERLSAAECSCLG
ncbi:artemin [Ornithorhynchus anatinus]|nr:artemin [Ornithorhynchus anatinus]